MVLLGFWRTALLFACKWAASNSMTTEAINNGAIGWNPQCKIAQFEHKCRDATGMKTIINVQQRSFYQNLRKHWTLHWIVVLKAESLQAFVSSSYRFWAMRADAPYWTCRRHQKTSSCNYSLIIATSQIIIRGWQNSEAGWGTIDSHALSLGQDQENKTWNLLSSWKF